MKTYDVAVIGSWHLAHVTAAVLASVGHRVALINPDQDKPWSEYPSCPVHEPGIPEMISEARSKQLLTFENGLNEGWQAKFIWMAVDTPVDDDDRPDLTPLNRIAQRVAQTQKPQAFIISSQVPISYCGKTEDFCRIPVAYVPENLRLGQGIETFLRADRTVIGARKKETAQLVKDLMVSFPTEFLLCNLETSEMVKHANNIFLATSISFANEIARVGESYGVDGATVARALKLDKRIGKSAYVAPGLGFAGGTLPRDLRVLQNIGLEKKIPTPLVDAVLTVNENTTAVLCDLIAQASPKKEKPILIMGYTYKADTDTLRRSLSIDLARELKGRGYSVEGYDPFMNGKDISNIKPYLEHVSVLSQLKAPAVAVVMTGRKDFSDLPWKSLAEKWGQTLILDAVGSLKPEALSDVRLPYKRLWSPTI